MNLDVLVIAAGFLLRILGGINLIDVYPSNGLIICATLLSLFLGFSKRRPEIMLLGDKSNSHRQVLQHYRPYFLDPMIGIITASTLISYML